jgi:hypothetical protein
MSGRSKKRSKIPPSPRRDHPPSDKPSAKRPWWKHFGIWAATVILAPVIVGLVLQHTGTHKASSIAASLPDFKHDLCTDLKVGIQCNLTDLGADSYMSREPMVSLQGVPSCAADISGFRKWAEANAVGATNELVLNITSVTPVEVEIEDLQVAVVDRGPPFYTTRIDCAGGSISYMYSMVNLDTNPPSVKYYCNDQRCPVPNAILQEGQSLEFRISAGSRRGLTEWRGRIDLIVNGRFITLDLGTHVSAPLVRTGVVRCEPSGNQWSCF